MANTGKKIVLTLQQVEPPSNTPTGLTKNNTIGDPDYIAPYTDLVACPVTADTTCADFYATGGVGSVQFEFSLPASVLSNTSIASVRVSVMNNTGTTEQNFTTYTLPLTVPQYQYGVFSGVSVGQHQMRIQYINSSSGVVATCPYTTLITVT